MEGARFESTETPEYLVGACIYVPEWGKEPKLGTTIFTGYDHNNARQQLINHGELHDCNPPKKLVKGFWTSRNEFVDRHRGLKIAETAGQLNPNIDEEEIAAMRNNTGLISPQVDFDLRKREQNDELEDEMNE